MTVLSLRSLVRLLPAALLALGALSAAPRTTKVKDHLYSLPVIESGGWVVTRYSTDPESKKLAFCTAISIQAAEQALRLEDGPRGFQISFMGEASGAMGPQVNLKFWFGAKNAPEPGKTPAVFRLFNSPDEDVEFLGMRDAVGQRANANRFLASPAIHFGYRYENQNIIQSFSLRNSAVTLQKFFACAAN